jgi:hypothetical protein
LIANNCGGATAIHCLIGSTEVQKTRKFREFLRNALIKAAVWLIHQGRPAVLRNKPVDRTTVLLPLKYVASSDHRLPSRFLKANLHLVFGSDNPTEMRILVDKMDGSVVRAHDADKGFAVVWRTPGAN